MTAVPQRNSLEIGLVSSALETDYEVLEELGRGGMAVVYRAREKSLDREVAIKVLPAVLSFDNGFVERFEREAKTAAQLEHPSIVPIYRVGRSGSVIFFVMKFLRGQSLSAVLRERAKLTVDEVRKILMDTAGALGYAAKRGVVHRDIKPDNILLDHDGRCVITDFGIAKTESGPLTAAGTSMGTPRYMSPEHAQGLPLDGRSDMYSLGVVAYQCLVGDIPFDGPDPFAVLYKHINTPLPVPELSTESERTLFGVIEKMLQKRQEDRYQSADELISALGGPTTPTSTTLVAGIMASRLLVEKTEIIPTGPTAHLKRFLARRLPMWAAVPALAVLAVAGWFALRAAASADTATPPPATKGVGGAQGSGNQGATLPPGGAPALGTVAGATTGATTAARPVAVAPPQPAAKKQTAPFSRCLRAPTKLSLLLDTVRPLPQGAKLNVSYDVCGLKEGSPYTAQITVTRIRQSRINRLVAGGVRPLADTLLASAINPRTRVSRTVDVSGFPPGSYSLAVAVTDRDKKRVERARQFEILERKQP